MLPPFPVKQLEDYYRRRINAISSSDISSNALPLIRFCHWRSGDEAVGSSVDESADDKFELWGEFSEAKLEIKRCLANKEQPPPILIFGLLSLEQVREFPNETKPLQWKGVQYLCYDASDDDLRRVVQKAIDGAQEDVPESLWVTQDDLNRKNQELHHYLTGRLNAIDAHRRNFELARDSKLEPGKIYHRKPIIAVIPPKWRKEMDCRRVFKKYLGLEVTPDDEFSRFIKAFEDYVGQIETMRQSLLGNESASNQEKQQLFATIAEAAHKAYIELEKAIKALEKETPCL